MQSQARRSDMTDEQYREELISAARDRVGMLHFLLEEAQRVMSEIDRMHYNKLILECAAIMPPVSIYDYIAERCLTDENAIIIVQQLHYILDVMDAFDQHRVILNNILAAYIALQFQTPVTSII